MLILVNMMSTPKVESALAIRLERLTGEEASCCVPEYEGLAKGIAASAGFRDSLKRLEALADEHRLLALAMLKRRPELCACEIQAATRLSHATVSHHMAVLVDAKLVTAHRKGKWMYYRIADRPDARVP